MLKVTAHFWISRKGRRKKLVQKIAPTMLHVTCLTQKGTKVVPIHLTWFLKIPSRR